MKKIITCFLFSICSVSFAQNREKGAIELTPLIGFASSNYVSNRPINNNPINSINFGVNGDFYFNNRWSLRSGLLFQSMGSETAFSPRLKDELKYISIPLNANWHFGSERNWNLNFGPSFSFLTSANTNGTDIKNLVETFQLGLAIGIGYKITINEKIGILMDFQGFSGFTNVNIEGDDDIKNSYSTFNVGCVYKL